MKTTTINVPNMYADHHVQEVRRILLEQPGVIDVYASSAFRVVEVSYDESTTNDLEMSLVLDEGGYLSEWSVPIETAAATNQEERSRTFFRHSAVYENIQQGMSFAQKVPYQGRPLWNCPGMGVIKPMEE